MHSELTSTDILSLLGPYVLLRVNKHSVQRKFVRMMRVYSPTITSAPTSAIRLASSGLKQYGVVSNPSFLASLIIATSVSYPIPVSSRFCLKFPSISPTVGKFCTPTNPIDLSWTRNLGILRNAALKIRIQNQNPILNRIAESVRSDAHTPARTAV